MSKPKSQAREDSDKAICELWADPDRRDYERRRGQSIRDDPRASLPFNEAVSVGWTEGWKKAYSPATKQASEKFDAEFGA